MAENDVASDSEGLTKTSTNVQIDGTKCDDSQANESLFRQFLKEIKLIVTQLLTSPVDLNEIGFSYAMIVFSRTILPMFGILKRLIFVGGFAVFFYFNFISLSVNNKFMTLDPTAGNCTGIPKPLTVKSLKADYNGYWDGQQGYSPTKALYLFNLFSFMNIIEDYSLWMQQIDNVIQDLGNQAQSQDLALN